jgi:hypothetical protein
MIYPNRKELAEEMDNVINKFMSLNIPIDDTKEEHSIMVFMLVRKGYTLHAKSPTRLIKGVSVPIDDVFCVDEHLQDLHTLAMQSIENSLRYTCSEYTD